MSSDLRALWGADPTRVRRRNRKCSNQYWPIRRGKVKACKKSEHNLIPLFEEHPLLAERLPYIQLAELPTPVQKLNRVMDNSGLESLYIKRDDLSSRLYGGNKVRKLEFLLGRALQCNFKEVLTFGFAGSNHSVATAIFAQNIGIKSISMLAPQPNAHYVRCNLLMSHYCGAELHQHRNSQILRLATIYQLLRHKLKSGSFPMVIPRGGSSPLGAVGFVNAAFELKKQVSRGEMPEPDYIYVALGSAGTVAGLILGLRVTDMRSRVICVGVAAKQFTNAIITAQLHNKTSNYLHLLDHSFPKFELSEREIDVRHGYCGKGYAYFTEEGIAAARRIKENEGIELEGTYTGKTFACLVDDAEKGNLKDAAVLFWNTCNSQHFSALVANIPYYDLPNCFHRYFDEDVQPLDRQT